MRKNAAVLARDVAAVWSGLRAAVMVDYMLLLRSSMFAILGALAKCKPQGELVKQDTHVNLSLCSCPLRLQQEQTY